MTDILKLADSIDPHKQVGWERLPHDKGRPNFKALIAASDALRTLSTQAQMVRAAAIEEAAKAADQLAINLAKAGEAEASRGASLASANVRALRPTLDLDAMVERAAMALWESEASDPEWDRGPWDDCPDDAKTIYRNHARAVLTAIGLVGEE